MSVYFMGIHRYLCMNISSSQKHSAEFNIMTHNSKAYKVISYIYYNQY